VAINALQNLSHGADAKLQTPFRALTDINDNRQEPGVPGGVRIPARHRDANLREQRTVRHHTARGPVTCNRVAGHVVPQLVVKKHHGNN